MPKQPDKNEQKILGGVALELPRHEVGPVLVTITHDGVCEETGEPVASISFDLGEASMCAVYELTPQSLMMLAFILTKFANSMEGREV